MEGEMEHEVEEEGEGPGGKEDRAYPDLRCHLLHGLHLLHFPDTSLCWFQQQR